MTEEADFQKELDASPDDGDLRLVFADWLQEKGDCRAGGYRALGFLRRSPCLLESGRTERWVYWNQSAYSDDKNDHMLPGDWAALAFNGRANFKRWETRQQADDAAATAFCLLPTDRQTELSQRK